MENKKVAVIGGDGIGTSAAIKLAESKGAILAGGRNSGQKYAAAMSLATFIAKSTLPKGEYNEIIKEAAYRGLPIMEALEDVENLRLSCLAGDIPFESGLSAIEQALNETAEQAKLAADAMQQIMPIEYKALSVLYKPTEPLPIRTKPIKGGAYNCRKPKYKSKNRR